jgi:transglutaminase-like putative cysteine protease
MGGAPRLSRRQRDRRIHARRLDRETNGESVMRLRVGCQFAYESPAPTPAVVLVRPHPAPDHRIVREEWTIDPETPSHGYLDLFQNRCERLVLPTGWSTLRYDAVVEVSGEPDPVAPDAAQLPVEQLPDETLVYTLASRYCQTETLSQVAWHLFGQSSPGWARVQVVCDWVHAHIRYGLFKSTPLTTAVDVYVAGGGMCRDFAHLAITFCRALNIPARYVFGYMPDLGVPEPHTPMDFHAWFEAYLGDRWWTFDARFNTPRVGRIPVGIGRDAVDVAMVTSYGPALFRRMDVWADEDAGGDDDAGTLVAAGAGVPGQSEALVLGRGED